VKSAVAGVVLTVRDNRIGISTEVLPRIFDLFVQERQALDGSQGGLGIQWPAPHPARHWRAS
jgi:signal transduction histidine kinase